MDLDVYVLIPNEMIYKKRPKITFKGKTFFPKKVWKFKTNRLKKNKKTFKMETLPLKCGLSLQKHPSPLSPDHSM